jgi:HEAT repeat protein
LTAVPALAAALNDPDVSVRVTVTKSLGAIGHGAGAEAALQKALQDNPSTVRHAAAVALGTEAEPERGNPEEGVEPLVADFQTLLTFLNGGGPDARRLRDQDVLVRQVAVEAMAALGPKAKGALPELVTALKDRDLGVRKGALQALLYMGADAAPAVPELVQMLQDDSENLWLLLGVLDGIGKPATPALPRLLSVFRNKQMIPEARKFALEAMVRIDESSAETQAALQEAKLDPDGSVRAIASSLEDSK